MLRVQLGRRRRACSFRATASSCARSIRRTCPSRQWGPAAVSSRARDSRAASAVRRRERAGSSLHPFITSNQWAQAVYWEGTADSGSRAAAWANRSRAGAMVSARMACRKCMPS